MEERENEVEGSGREERRHAGVEESTGTRVGVQKGKGKGGGSWGAGTQGILLQSDVAIHAESRAVVQPAFRVENLRQHMASFAVTAQRMANILSGTGGRPLEVMVRHPPLPHPVTMAGRNIYRYIENIYIEKHIFLI